MMNMHSEYLKAAVRLFGCMVESKKGVNKGTLWSWDATREAIEQSPFAASMLKLMECCDEGDAETVLRYASEFEPLAALGEAFIFPDAASANSFAMEVRDLGGSAEILPGGIVKAYGPKREVIEASAATRGGSFCDLPSLSDAFEFVDKQLPYDMVSGGIPTDKVVETICHFVDGSLQEATGHMARFQGRLSRFAVPRKQVCGVDARLVEALVRSGRIPPRVHAYLRNRYRGHTRIFEQEDDAVKPGGAVDGGAAAEQGGVSKEQPAQGGGGMPQSKTEPQDKQKPPTEHVPTREEGSPTGDVRLADGTVVPEPILKKALAKLLRNVATQVEQGTESGQPEGRKDEPDIKGKPEPEAPDVPNPNADKIDQGGDQKVPPETPPAQPAPNYPRGGQQQQQPQESLQEVYVPGADLVDGVVRSDLTPLEAGAAADLADSIREAEAAGADVADHRMILRDLICVPPVRRGGGRAPVAVTPSEARDWAADARRRGYDTMAQTGRVNEVKKYHHVRIKDPKQFKKFRTINLGKGKGLKAVVGFPQKGMKPKGKGGSKIQAVLADPSKHTLGQAKAWAKRKGMKPTRGGHGKAGTTTPRKKKRLAASYEGPNSVSLCEVRSGPEILDMLKAMEGLVPSTSSVKAIRAFEAYLRNGRTKHLYEVQRAVRNAVRRFRVEGRVGVYDLYEELLDDLDELTRNSLHEQLDVGQEDEAMAASKGFKDAADALKRCRQCTFDLVNTKLVQLESLTKSIGSKKTSNFLNKVRGMTANYLDELQKIAGLLNKANEVFKSEGGKELAPEAPPADAAAAPGPAPEAAPAQAPAAPAPEADAAAAAQESMIAKAVARCVGSTIPERIFEGATIGDMRTPIMGRCVGIPLTSSMITEVYRRLRKTELVARNRHFRVYLEDHDRHLLEDVGSVLAARTEELRECVATETELRTSIAMLRKHGGREHGRLASVLDGYVEESLHTAKIRG